MLKILGVFYDKRRPNAPFDVLSASSRTS